MDVWSITVPTDAVEREIRALSPGHQADFLRVGELLCQYGPQAVGMPHVRSLGNKLWEMRLRDAEGIARAIYFAASGRRLVILHAFDKRTQKTPKRALDLARRRMREFLGDEQELRGSEGRPAARSGGASGIRRPRR
jgi:phage-related protein